MNIFPSYPKKSSECRIWIALHKSLQEYLQVPFLKQAEVLIFTTLLQVCIDNTAMQKCEKLLKISTRSNKNVSGFCSKQ